jgi:hypothetical protein
MFSDGVAWHFRLRNNEKRKEVVRAWLPYFKRHNPPAAQSTPEADGYGRLFC